MIGLVKITDALNLKVKLGRLDILTHMKYCNSDGICLSFPFLVARKSFTTENAVKSLCCMESSSFFCLFLTSLHKYSPDILVPKMK